MPNEVMPQHWTREQLVSLVKAVLGEVHQASDRFGMVHLYRGNPQSLELQFMVGPRIVGTYIVTLPPKMAAVLEDEAANTYNNLQVTVRATSVESALTALEAEPRGTINPDDGGRGR